MKLTSNIGHKGFTLIELMIVVAITGTLASIATPYYFGYIELARVNSAISEIMGIDIAVTTFMSENGRFPNTLIEAGLDDPVDPWGNLYVYYPLNNVPPKVKIRKNKSLHPVSTDFDLYSMGKDGKSVAPFTAQASQDDVVRANDGAFVGLVANY